MPKHYEKIAIDVEHELYDLTDAEKRELIENIKSILLARGDYKRLKKLEKINNKISKYTDVKLP
jgi:spermidine/putrescine-binding protein